MSAETKPCDRVNCGVRKDVTRTECWCSGDIYGGPFELAAPVPAPSTEENQQ